MVRDATKAQVAWHANGWDWLVDVETGFKYVRGGRYTGVRGERYTIV